MVGPRSPTIKEKEKTAKVEEAKTGTQEKESAQPVLVVEEIERLITTKGDAKGNITSKMARTDEITLAPTLHQAL